MGKLDTNNSKRPDAKSSLRDSSLTVAVIWDPENGLEAFPCAHLFETPVDMSTTDRDLFDSWSQSDESVSTHSNDEPFAVFGSRQPHYIDIRSSDMYKDIIGAKLGRVPSSPSSAVCPCPDLSLILFCF